MQVLKIVAEGLTTSFRYPHFMQQIHPSFQMPPPATIYGHICSTMGEWVDPIGLQFAYHFKYQKSGRDLEHTILLSASRGKLPGTSHPKVLEGNVNPFEREIMFFPQLTLYLNRPEWETNFRSPRYAVALGRSQDLFTYTDISVIALEQAQQAYFEHTIAPLDMALNLRQGIVVLMPRFLDYDNKRTPSFGRYVILNNRAKLGQATTQDGYWIDPTSPNIKQAHLGLFFHSFVGGENEPIGMA